MAKATYALDNENAEYAPHRGDKGESNSAAANHHVRYTFQRYRFIFSHVTLSRSRSNVSEIVRAGSKITR